MSVSPELRIFAWKLYCAHFKSVSPAAVMAHGIRRICKPPECVFVQFKRDDKYCGFCKISGFLHVCDKDCQFQMKSPRDEGWICAVTGIVLGQIVLDPWTDAHGTANDSTNLSTAMVLDKKTSEDQLKAQQMHQNLSRGPRLAPDLEEERKRFFKLAHLIISQVFEVGRHYYIDTLDIKYPTQAVARRHLEQYIKTLAGRGSPVVNLIACVVMVNRLTMDNNKRNPRLYEGALRSFDFEADKKTINQLSRLATDTFHEVQAFHAKQYTTKQIRYTIGRHIVGILVQCQHGIPSGRLPKIEGLESRLPPQDLMLQVLQEYAPSENVRDSRSITRTTTILTTALGMTS